ncbi:MAG: hypothetical protein KF832_07325 [Caldilineaceae bacterium]|nr:hypothetical protein [Caldilineaceae bacterium]
MFQVIYEQATIWPENGTFTVKTPSLEIEIQVSPDSARRRANGYLARYIGFAMEAGDPALVWGDKPVWRLPIHLTLRGWGQVAKLGELDVDALTRDVLPLSPVQIREMQDRANAIAARLTSTTN